MIANEKQNAELKVQIRGYLIESKIKAEKDNDRNEAAKQSVASHIFRNLRGKSNLVFANSRQNVEWYSDQLSRLSQKDGAPLEFFPHHASLVKDDRHDLEKRLKTGAPTTAVCTSTLELGIDIGSVDCVAQIGPPFSVSSLRQRIGRSGRRDSQAAVLWMHALENETDADSLPLDRLHLGLIRSIAMIELLVQKWCEPPEPEALHLSTLTHQILSATAEHGGLSAKRMYETLCEKGPFRQTSKDMFIRLLRQLARPEVALIEQDPQGNLLPGRAGEKLVEHYTFYAVFQTTEDYRVLNGTRQLGTVPTKNHLIPGMGLILAGRRWTVTEIHEEDKVIQVIPSRTGTPAQYDGTAGGIHDRVVMEMISTLAAAGAPPTYINNTSAKLLNEARAEFKRLDVQNQRICRTADTGYIIATYRGTAKTATLAMVLQSMNYQTITHDGFIEAKNEGDQSPQEALQRVAQGNIDETFLSQLPLDTEKYHRYLSQELLFEDAKSSWIDLKAMPELAKEILGATVQ